ncbi:MAG: type 4a pilus biogenesis protein PilO [Elusimicrobia bacterium]|nr:type 4a pilus biogenesis protein PilO [Elusimicrobiota bacterium]
MNKINIDNKLLIKIASVAVMFGAVLFIYLFYFWFPVSKKIADMNENLKKIDAEINQAKEIKSKYNDLSKTLLDLTEQKIEMERKLPNDKNMPDLVRTIKKIADKYYIKINSISPATEVKDQYFFKVSYNIAATGSYHNIGKFFAEIALQERILNIENLSLSQGEESSVNFVLVSYRYDDGKNNL